MQYREDVGSEGVKAEDAAYDKLVAAGMTDTPKVRFNNSILAPEANATADAKAAPAAPTAPAAALMQKQDTIGEPKYDYSVYDFSHKAIYDPLEGDREATGPALSNGWAAGAWSLAQRNKHDISDKNIDEEVVGFVRADKNMMPIPQFARRSTAYPVNGYANTPPSTVSDLVQRSAKDISDKNIDEEVVGMVRADKNMMPIPQFARRSTAYPVNGYANTPPSVVSNLAQKKDISQPGVEPNVYDFVHDKVEALNWERRP